MKKLLIYSMLFSSIFANAQSTVVVDSEGALMYPTKADFTQANDLASQSDLEEVEEDLVPKSSLSVFIDLYRDGMDDIGGNRNTYSYVYASYYSDCVLKVLDPQGNLLYFFSTVVYYSEQLQSMHSSSIYDNTATVYYYPTGRNNSYTNGTNNLRSKTLFPSTAWSTHCIATYEESYSGQSVYNGITSVGDSKIRITAIQIYPSSKFHSIFLNPENTIIYHRQNVSTAELDGKGSHLFRPAIIQYLR